MNLYPLKTDVQKSDVHLGNNNDKFDLIDFKKGEILNGLLAENTLEELLEVYMYDLAGEKVYSRFGNSFPLSVSLIKTSEQTPVLIDAMQEDSQHAVRLWHILDSDNSYVNIGCKNKAELSLHVYEVQKGDTLIVKANQAFQIEAGVTILEVAYSPSDLNRSIALSDLSESQLERLNISPKKDAIVKVKIEPNSPKNLYQSEDITTNQIAINGAIVRDYYPLDSFVIISCADGQLILEGDFEDALMLQKGECAFIPADIKELKFKALTEECTILETYISNDK